MQKPQESLHDFLNSIEPQEATPPSIVSLRPTGEFEILRPLPPDRAPGKTANGLRLEHGAPRISWFHRSLIFGGAAAATVAIIFLSAVVIGISERSDGASVDNPSASSHELEAPVGDSLAMADEPAMAHVLTAEVASLVVGKLRTNRAAIVISRRSATRVQRAAYIPRRIVRPAKSPSFVPTTLIIYAENGEIKTRIEPTLTAGYKIPVSFSN